MLLDLDREVTYNTLLRSRDSCYYKYDEAAFERFQSEIVSIYQTAVDILLTYIKSPLLVDRLEEALERRCSYTFQKVYKNN